MVKELDSLCPGTSKKFLSYGCFCGKGPNLDKLKTNGTMDEFDGLCRIHDWCYNVNRKTGCNDITGMFHNFVTYYHFDNRIVDKSAFGGKGKKRVSFTLN